MNILFFLVSFGASMIGAICGIGGGIIIKPTLDVFNVMSVATISFLSGCTVLSMACYSVVKTHLEGYSKINKKTGIPLALGAAFGGIAGKIIFQNLSKLFSNEIIGTIQAVCLLLITVGTLLYAINKTHIKTYHIMNPIISLILGSILGILSSFLGIGGGPINLVLLYFFFSMPTKIAAENSLYIILYSQIASLISILISGNVPPFQFITLLIMILAGITGGICGRKINKKISENVVDKLGIYLMFLLILINVYNILKLTI